MVDKNYILKIIFIKENVTFLVKCIKRIFFQLSKWWEYYVIVYPNSFNSVNEIQLNFYKNITT